MAIIAEYVKQYQDLNWFLVPLQKGEKKPIAKNWTEKESCIAPEVKLTSYPGGIGLAHAYSRTCTIDLDDLTKARDWFSKKKINIDSYLNDDKNVKIVSGVKNKAKLLYLLPPNSELLPHVKRDNDGFELRCATRKGTTIQDALPPSIHPKTKKPYEWVGDPRNTPVLPVELGKIWYEFIESNKSHVEVKNAGALIPFITNAIELLDPDMEYNDWLSVGFALHSVGPDLIDVWENWSSEGDKYQLGDCESRWLGFDQAGGVTLGTFFKMAYDQQWSPQTALLNIVKSYNGTNTEMVSHLVALSYHLSIGPMLFEDIIKQIKITTGASIKAIKTAWKYELDKLQDEEGGDSFELTHSEMADLFIKDLKAEYPPNIIASQDQLWYYHEQYYKGVDRKRIGGIIGRKFSLQKLCKTGAQYRQIASHIVTTDQRPHFFNRAPEGVATKQGFFRIDEAGNVEHEINSPEHRQRWLIPIEPKKGKKPLFDAMLNNALGHDPSQILLLQQVVGAIIFNRLTAYQKAILFFGEGSTGKSVLIDVIRALFPEDRVTNISPEKFNSEYNLATLSSSALNTYEELPDAKSISSPEFKALVAGGAMRGRQIYGDPIEYRAKCSHVFSTNYLPTTNEVGNAFFRRWLLFHFKNPVSDDVVDVNYTRKIIQGELGQIFQWGIDGMKSLVKRQWQLSTSHEDLLQRWTRTSNVVLEFLHDTDWILMKAEAIVKRADLYVTYKEWCRYHDRPMINKGEFNHRTALSLHVEKPSIKDGIEIWRGLGLLMDRPSF